MLESQFSYGEVPADLSISAGFGYGVLVAGWLPAWTPRICSGWLIAEHSSRNAQGDGILTIAEPMNG